MASIQVVHSHTIESIKLPVEGGTERHLSSHGTMQRFIVAKCAYGGLRGFSFLFAIKFPLANLVSIRSRRKFSGARTIHNWWIVFIRSQLECSKFTNSIFIEETKYFGNSIWSGHGQRFYIVLVVIFIITALFYLVLVYRYCYYSLYLFLMQNSFKQTNV